MAEVDLTRAPDGVARYWETTEQGRFELQQCDDCGHWRYPASALCPACLSVNASWRPVSGNGTIWSWIRMHQRYFPEGEFDLPYVVAMIELDEGAVMIAGVVGNAASQPPIGAAVTAELQQDQRGKRTVPVFRLVGDQ